MDNNEQINIIKQWLKIGAINIFGRPFSGKDTQGKRLANFFDGNLVGGGEILRSDTMPDRIKAYMHTGKLIPSSDYEEIVLPYLQQSQFTNKPLILSSVGRWHGEEPGVIAALEKSNHTLKAVIYLDLSESESRNRWNAREINNDRPNRHDDSDGILDIRFTEFREKTLPVLDYYNNLNLLITVSGAGTRDEITNNIIKSLIEFANN